MIIVRFLKHMLIKKYVIHLFNQSQKPEEKKSTPFVSLLKKAQVVVYYSRKLS